MKHQVRVVSSGECFACCEEQHLLEGMQAFRIGEPLLRVIPVGCRGGGCGVCRIRVLEGEYETRKMSCKHIPVEDQASGLALACRVFPRSELLIEVLGEERTQCAGESGAGPDREARGHG